MIYECDYEFSFPFIPSLACLRREMKTGWYPTSLFTARSIPQVGCVRFPPSPVMFCRQVLTKALMTPPPHIYLQSLSLSFYCTINLHYHDSRFIIPLIVTAVLIYDSFLRTIEAWLRELELESFATTIIWFGQNGECKSYKCEVLNDLRQFRYWNFLVETPLH